MPEYIQSEYINNQSADSTGGSIVFECMLGKWSWTRSAASDLGLHYLPMSQSRFFR